MSAVEQFNQLGAEISSLELREAQLKAGIQQAFQSLCVEQGIDGQQENGFMDLLNIPERLTVVVSAKNYVQALQELQEASKDLERSVREAARAAKDGGQTYTDAVQSCCSSYMSASLEISKIQPTPIEAQAKQLSKLANQLMERVKESAASLKHVSEEYIEQQMQLCDWPPSLVSSQDEEELKSAGGFWELLQKSGNPALMDLGTGLVAISYVQQAIEGKTQMGDQLWFMTALASPLGQKMRLHFASDDSSTSDISKPEWLFKTAGKLIREHAEGMQYFQGVLPLAGLEGIFDLSVEFVRCMQASLQELFTKFWLPKLESRGPTTLWLDWTEEAERFDKEMMDLAGISEDSGEIVQKFRASSCLAAFCQKKEWVAAWCASEAEEQLQQMDDIMGMQDAWDPANDDPSLYSLEQEVWPPKCAEKLWGLVIVVIHKSKAIPGALGQAWLQQVGRPILHEIHRRLVSVVKQVESFKQILEYRYAKKLAGCVCTARYLEHNLQEWDDEPSLSSQAPLPTVFSRELGSFTAVKRKWSMNFGKAAAQQFQSDTAGYRNQLGAFAINPRVEPPQDMNVSPLLVTAILHLRDSCTLLASLLDGVSFREIWKAIAMAATRFLFNDVATEASFTKWGSYQFSFDCAALIEVFRPYTKRPHAYLKELQEACTLLTCPIETLSYIQNSVSSTSDQASKQHLMSVGVSRLSPKQALSIIERRME